MKKLSVDAMMSRMKADPQIEHLRAENSELKNALKASKKKDGEQAELLSEILSEIEVAEPPEMKYEARQGTGKSVASMAGQLTDLHIGQKTDPSEIEGFGEFNYDIAVRRMGTFANKLIDLAYTNRNAYDIQELVVLGTGDYISGDIHQELLVTNEFPSPVQAVKAGYLIGEFLRTVSAHFPRVRAELVTLDNHGRLTKKPQKGQGGFNNFGYISAHIAKEYLSQCKNIEMKIHPAVSAIIPVQGTKYLAGHGHGIVGQMGIPWYGIERKKGREALARFHMTDDKKHDKIVLGHFHTAINHPDWMMGGSLSGTDANDHDAGRHGEPCQTAWFVHPKHGEFSWTRFWL